ncbi:MAG: hypothetical protein AAF726_18475 [Planctomycetota bacterium]
MLTSRLAPLGGFLLVSGLTASAQDRFATSILDYQQGSGGGIFDPSNLLGGPQGFGLGGGALDVLTLGVSGQVTCGFDVTIVDGPGADFTVYENPFVVGGGPAIFAEYAFVEVSTDGVNFARFPSTLPLEPSVWGANRGLSGNTPGIANVLTNTIDPFDPVESGGDSFDLSELALDPLVVGGQVDLQNIQQVRLVDVGVNSAGGSDFDAIAVIQHAGNQASDGPICDLTRDAAGFVRLRLADPDGLVDLDLTQLRVSVNLVEVPVFRLRSFFVLESSTPFESVLVSPQPIGAFNFEAQLAVSVRDLAGNFSGDQISLNP